MVNVGELYFSDETFNGDPAVHSVREEKSKGNVFDLLIYFMKVVLRREDD